MPVWGVVADERMLFSTDPDSIKGRNMTERPSIVVHLESGDDVVIVDGTAERVDGSALPGDFVPLYTDKYGFEIDTSQPSYGFYEVHPTAVLVWEEARFPDSAARWQFS